MSGGPSITTLKYRRLSSYGAAEMPGTATRTRDGVGRAWVTSHHTDASLTKKPLALTRPRPATGRPTPDSSYSDKVQGRKLESAAISYLAQQPVAQSPVARQQQSTKKKQEVLIARTGTPPTLAFTDHANRDESQQAHHLHTPNGPSKGTAHGTLHDCKPAVNDLCNATGQGVGGAHGGGLCVKWCDDRLHMHDKLRALLPPYPPSPSSRAVYTVEV